MFFDSSFIRLNQKQTSRPRSPLVFVACGLLIAFSKTPVHSQTGENAGLSEIEALRQQVAALQKRLDALEAAQRRQLEQSAPGAERSPLPNPTASPTPAPPSNAPSPSASLASVATATKLPVTVSGLIQVQSLNYLNEDINNNGNSSNDTFRLRRGEIRVTAPAITRIISGTLSFDVAKFTSGSGTNTNIRARDNILQDLQVSVRLNQTRKSTNFIDIGQFKIPIGYESLISTNAVVPFTERSLIFTQRDPFDGGYGDVRDAGLQLRGSYGQFEYRVGIFNGLGDRQNALALSDQKAFLGWLGVRPKFVPGLLVGISGGKGKTGVQTVVGNTTVTTRDDRDLRNAFFTYKRRKFSLQGEYLQGKAAPLIVGTGSVAGRDVQGYYLGGGYYLTPKLEFVARYDALNTNRALNAADVRDVIAGLNYYIKDNNAKLQLNVVKFSGNDNAPTNANPITNLRNDRLELRSGIQVSF